MALLLALWTTQGAPLSTSQHVRVIWCLLGICLTSQHHLQRKTAAGAALSMMQQTEGLTLC
jgi:hypothetical protein